MNPRIPRIPESSALPHSPGEWTERTLIRDGVRLSLRDWCRHPDEAPGKHSGRAPLLLLHGLAGHAGEWDGIARRLRADGHRVVALDQRGHGVSERRPRDVTREAYVADILTVIDRLGLHRPVLIGQSYGGHAALLAAAAHSARLSGAVLVEAGPAGTAPGTVAEVGDWLRAWPVPFPTREAAVAYLGGGPVGEGWADGLEVRDDGLWPRFDPEVLVAALAENSGRDRWEEWAAIGVPVLAVLGRRGIVSTEQYGGMAERQPARLHGVGIPDAGHDLHLEQPGVLHAVLRDFLSGIPYGLPDPR
ncbi:alpha/beta fold hydrolase [Streptomyces sp. NPDC048718]|uniref:alpha/beta fold hydrolase n=1 Tax=Streptomyces sp. NPDC048718 TaxID=3365587 RepID=UPI003723E090